MGEVIIHTVDGLKPDTTYVFIIRAENIEGFSAPSPASNSIKTKPRQSSGRNKGGLEEELDDEEARNQLSASDIELISAEPDSSTSIRISWKVNLLIYLCSTTLIPTESCLPLFGNIAHHKIRFRSDHLSVLSYLVLVQLNCRK